MKEFHAGINEISEEITQKLKKIYEEFSELKPDLSDDYDIGSAIISFRLGLDYFITAKHALRSGRIISGGAVTRCALENICDLFYVYDKPEKYPKKYVESMEDFRQIMLRAGASKKGAKVLAVSRELKHANNWTNASIDDRVKASGAAFVTMYDLFSYYSHPNPGSLTYEISPDLKEKQTNLMQQANCMTALTLMKLVVNHTNIKSVSRSELEILSKKLGFPL